MAGRFEPDERIEAGRWALEAGAGAWLVCVERDRAPWVYSRKDAEDLIALLERVRERLPP